MRRSALLTLLLLASALLIAAGLWVGSTGWRGGHASIDAQILWQIRLPRSLGAWLAGALLGLAGVIAQGLFRNPLADPYLLGSASGATLAVALSLIAFGGHTVLGLGLLVQMGMTGAAFVGAALAVILTIAMAGGAAQTMRLLLSGVIVGVVLGAATSLVTLTYPETLQTMQSFMLGTTSFLDTTSVRLMLGVLLACLAFALALAPVLDGLVLGEATAKSLGLPIKKSRVVLIAALALATGAAVAQTGLVAFVGLAAPHMVRALCRASARWTLLLSALMGGALLLAADVLARAAIAPQELPVGLLTALLGGVYLLYLMHRSGHFSREA